ncbi:MAG: hypothetical protein WDN23_19465 [Edaphobacter sp.]
MQRTEEQTPGAKAPPCEGMTSAKAKALAYLGAYAEMQTEAYAEMQAEADTEMQTEAGREMRAPRHV